MAERGHSWLQASKGSQRPFDDGHAWGGFRVSVSVSVKLVVNIPQRQRREFSELWG